VPYHSQALQIDLLIVSVSAKLDYPSLGDRQLLSERLADFKFTADPKAIDDARPVGRSKHTGKEEELDSEDEVAFQDPPATDNMDVVEAPGNQSAPTVEPQDFFAGDEGAGGDDYGGDYGGGDFEDAGGEAGEIPNGEGGKQPGFVPFDPRRVPDQRELVMAMSEEGAASMMDYFDASITKNWAGPEHWKLRKVIRKRTRAIWSLHIC